MAKEYFFLYLVYGLVFVSMGIFASYKKDEEVSHLPLVKSLKYLGVFGITHGLSEWVTMIVIADLYPDLYVYLFIIKQILKAISFVFLIGFGTTLLPKYIRYKSIINKMPILLLTVWGTLFILLMVRNGLHYHLINPQYNTTFLRYFMGLPGGVITSLALRLQGKQMNKRNLDTIVKKYNHLAYIFLIYGLVDGMIVREMDFFPANVINNQAFLQWFGFPIQIIKIMVGISINILLIRVIKTFGWEQKERLQQLQEQKIADEERRKLGLEIHDSIIQSIYAANLKLQCLIDDNKEASYADLLQEIQLDLGNTIKKTREFISTTSLKTVELKDLTNSIVKLVEIFNNNQDIKIDVESEMPELYLRELSTEKSSQIYYVVQEALSNVIKHSKGNRAMVLVKTVGDFLYIKVKDNGVGIQLNSIDSKQQFGLISMKKRAETVGATLSVKNIEQGTEVELIVPWEDSNHVR
ncbi:ATP-binding protein [Serpentinicella sp. ANB-PHB4]|uniref:sensor histidine kinase n=1 Tax=Serpentinicella sp. ANB-PHB4 TaxID=3074076 RepID=UPI00285938D1|nr:ATP-binding protein [Serpentinicella sp. ANB-PHB4]MDR5658392.1 ATP-binding protein [Serpentinicella sp. ANB-PHB4]